MSRRTRLLSFSTALAALALGAGLGVGTAYSASSDWHATTAPTRAHSDVLLYDVSCATAASCTSVGTWIDNHTGTDHPYAARLGGSKWVASHIAVSRSDARADLYGVDCPTTSRCVAVGQVTKGKPLILARTGASWQHPAAPRVSNATGALRGVSCVGTTFCMAVGSYTPLHHRTEFTLTDVRRNGTWHRVTSPNPTKQNVLGAVSCVSASFCVAVGGYSTGQARLGTIETHPLVVVWNGSSWRRVRPADREGYNFNAADGISCVSTTFCVAPTSSGSSDHPLGAISYDGLAWTTTALPVPAGSYGSYDFHDISCTSASSCTVVGDAVPATVAPRSRPLAEVWNGTGWQIEWPAAPTPRSELDGVTCTASRCEAIGQRTRNGRIDAFTARRS